jgi:hypothetical protein
MNAYELADDVIHMLESWSKAYPTSMFPDPTQEDIDYINAQNKNLSARFFAHVGRHFINKGFTPAINILRQQADKIAKYEEVLQAIANDYHELSDHKIEVQVRNHKKWARDVLSLSGNTAKDVGNISRNLQNGKE